MRALRPLLVLLSVVNFVACSSSDRPCSNTRVPPCSAPICKNSCACDVTFSCRTVQGNCRQPAVTQAPTPHGMRAATWTAAPIQRTAAVRAWTPAPANFRRLSPRAGRVAAGSGWTVGRTASFLAIRRPTKGARPPRLASSSGAERDVPDRGNRDPGPDLRGPHRLRAPLSLCRHRGWAGLRRDVRPLRCQRGVPRRLGLSRDRHPRCPGRCLLLSPVDFRMPSGRAPRQGVFRFQTASAALGRPVGPGGLYLQLPLGIYRGTVASVPSGAGV
jgi:hypothetical protein